MANAGDHSASVGRAVNHRRQTPLQHGNKGGGRNEPHGAAPRTLHARRQRKAKPVDLGEGPKVLIRTSEDSSEDTLVNFIRERLGEARGHVLENVLQPGLDTVMQRTERRLRADGDERVNNTRL